MCWGSQGSGACRKPSSCCSRKQRGCGFLTPHSTGLGGGAVGASAPRSHGRRSPGPHPTALQPCGSQSLGPRAKDPQPPPPTFPGPQPHSPRLPELQPSPTPRPYSPQACPPPAGDTLTIFLALLWGRWARPDARTEGRGGCQGVSAEDAGILPCTQPAQHPRGVGIRAHGPARPRSALSTFPLCPRCAAGRGVTQGCVCGGSEAGQVG